MEGAHVAHGRRAGTMLTQKNLTSLLTTRYARKARLTRHSRSVVRRFTIGSAQRGGTHASTAFALVHRAPGRSDVKRPNASGAVKVRTCGVLCHDVEILRKMKVVMT